MNPLVLREKTSDLEVTFLPGYGMNCISFKKGGREIIDQSTLALFEERFAGLGALIGPHFHQRDSQSLPPLENPSLFPHIARALAHGSLDPFSHGIGRYAPWNVLKKSDKVVDATLSGDDKWKGIALKNLEGQNFQMHYTAELSPSGLLIQLSVKSEKPSVVGLHTYYALEHQAGQVFSTVGPKYNDQGVWKEKESRWGEESQLIFPLSEQADFGFLPADDLQSATIVLKTGGRTVSVNYSADSDQNSWQLWHPAGSSFVCIEPLSARDPRHPELTASSLEILISVH